jgi:hypothetical protein
LLVLLRFARRTGPDPRGRRSLKPSQPLDAT